MIKNNEKSAEILRAEEQLAQAKARFAEAKRKEGARKRKEEMDPKDQRRKLSPEGRVPGVGAMKW